MWKKITAALIGTISIIGVITVNTGGSSTDSIPSIEPLVIIAALSIFSGFIIHYSLFKVPRPSNLIESAVLGGTICSVAAIGYTSPTRAFLNLEMLYFILFIGTLPVLTGAAVRLRTNPHQYFLILLIVVASILSAIYIGGDLTFRVLLHLAAVLPGFIFGFIITDTKPN